MIITTEKILKSISTDWKNLTRIQNDLKITDNLDIRFLKLKLKEFERKKLIECKNISKEKHYKCFNDLQELDKNDILTNKSPLSKEQLVPIKKTSENINKISLETKILKVVKLEENVKAHSEHLKKTPHDESRKENGGKTQKIVKNEIYFCSVCNLKFKSNLELKKHQKVIDHLFLNEVIGLLIEHYGNTDLHKEAISFIQNLKSKREKGEKSILIRVIVEKIKKSGRKKANLDLHKLLVKYNPGNSTHLENLGDICVEIEDYKDAKIAYKRALKLTSNKSVIQSKLSTLYFRMGDQESAIASIKKIIPTGPNMSQARLDSTIKRDWKRLKSELMSQSEKLPNIPKEILDEKLKKFEQCEKQYLFWHINCPPTQKEISILNRFMRTINAKFIQENNSIIHYRTFDKENNTSIHIKAIRKGWGAAINVHRDLFKHQYTIFDKKCLELISKLYIFLEKKRGGHRFILPRQEKNFQSYLGERFIKKFKYKR